MTKTNDTLIHDDYSRSELEAFWKEKYQEMDTALADSSVEAVSKAFKTKDGFYYRLITNKEGGRGLIFVFPKIASVKKMKFRNYEGIRITCQRNYKNQDEICLYSPLIEIRDFFITLLVQLFESVRACKNANNQVLLIIAWLEEKAEFFQETKNRMWTPEKEIGLFGELHTLEWLYGYIKNWTSVLGAWKGSFGSPHDFEFPSVHIESKIIQKDKTVSFHGVYQTYCPVPTFLHAIQIDKGYGFTLFEKIVTFKRGMTRVEIEIFDECLKKVGFEKKHDDSRELYNVTSTEFYLMSHPDFPSYDINPLYHGINLKLRLHHIEFAKAKCLDVQRNILRNPSL